MEVRLIEDEVKTKGLYEKIWMRWMSLRVKESMKKQGRLNLDEVGLTFSTETDEVKCNRGEFWDSMSGKKLSAEGVTKARAEEM